MASIFGLSRFIYALQLLCRLRFTNWGDDRSRLVRYWKFLYGAGLLCRQATIFAIWVDVVDFFSVIGSQNVCLLPRCERALLGAPRGGGLKFATCLVCLVFS